MLDLWRGSGFRVWTRKPGEEGILYEPFVYCESLDHNGPTLYTRMPGGRARLVDEYYEIELHYDRCGDPTVYIPERVKFRCHSALAAGWRIEPLNSPCPEESGILSHYYVRYHCEDIEWMNQDDDWT